ncbi:MAG: MFS transporter [Vicinamibacterales bacterium]
MPALSITARLNALPIVRTHRAATAIVGIGVFFDLFDIFLAGVLGTVLSREFSLSPIALQAVLASGFVGMFAGAAGLGAFADRFGRRTAFMVNLAIYSVFTLAGAFAPNAAWLIAARLIAGVGIGAELPLCDTYLGELLPAKHRGRYTAIAYTIGFTGVPAVGWLARVLVPIAPLGIAGWRWVFAIGSMGGAIVWMLRSRLPESPRWLDAAGHHLEAVRVVAAMEAEAPRTSVAHAGAPLADGGEPGAASFGTHGTSTRAVRPARVPLKMLFSPEYRGRTLMLWVFQAFQAVGYYGFGTIVPLVLVAKGFSIVTSLTYTSLVFIGYPIGSALSIPIVERVDRRWLIVASAFLMAAFGLGLGAAQSPVAIVLLGVGYTMVANVFSNAFHVLQAELFPTAVRATAAGTAYGLSRLSSAAMPFVLLPLLDRSGAVAAFGAVGLAMVIVMVDVGLFAPSTTGRSLEDVAGG